MEWVAIVALGVMMAIAYITGRKSGERDTKVDIAKEISAGRIKDAQDEYTGESNMSDDAIVDTMLEWLRTRSRDTDPEQ